MASTIGVSKLRKLSVKERLKLIELLWSTLEEEGVHVELSPEDLEEIKRRDRELDEHPERGIPFEEGMKRLRSLR